MMSDIFFSNIKKIPKIKDTDSMLNFGELITFISEYIEKKTEINGDNIKLIVNSLKYYLFDRKPSDEINRAFEIKIATHVLEFLLSSTDFNTHLKNYFLGVDITDDEMANSAFAKPRR